MKKSIKRFPGVTKGLAVIASFSLLGLAGCADGTTDNPDSGETIKVGLARTLTYMSGFVADGGGFLEDEAETLGRDIEVIPFDSSSQSLAALAAGQIDMDVQMAQNAARSQLQGRDLVITATLNSAGVGALVVSNDVQEPKDLEGKTVAFTGPATAAYPLLLAALEKDGVDASKVDFLTISDQSAFQDALANGEVDGILPGEPVISNTVTSGDGHVMYDFFDREFVEKIMGGPYASVTLMTTSDFIENNSAGVQAVTSAFLKANQWILDNKDNTEAVMSVLPSNYSGIADIIPSLIARISSAIPESPKTSEQALRTILEVDIEQGSIEEGAEVDLEKLFDNSFLP